MPAATAEAFARERPRLVGLAYRITGSLADAEDVVQDAWLRFERATDVERPQAWLTTVVARLALDALKSAQRRREAYVGPWLPEPRVTDPRFLGEPGPEETAELADSLTLGFLHLLEALGPAERVVFILADVFAVPFGEIAPVVGRSEAACRQVASRARRRLRAERPRSYRAPGDVAARTVGALLAATVSGDVEEVVRLLGDDVVLISDGGAERRAARRPVRGPGRVARLLVNLAKRFPELSVEPLAINGELGVVASMAGEPLLAMAAEVVDGEVVAIHVLRSAEKLAALDRRVELV